MSFRGKAMLWKISSLFIARINAIKQVMRQIIHKDSVCYHIEDIKISVESLRKHIALFEGKIKLLEKAIQRDNLQRLRRENSAQDDVK